ncbi:MAG: MCE family protein, partial [Acetobacteraceae bacterium]|nr:MCE family protein [Acetobacteraceae bacterium]
MRGRAAFLRVGLFVIGATVVGILLILFLGGPRLASATKYETYFRESVQGLDVGAPVKYRGVTIGQVTDIGLVGAEYGGADLAQEIQHADYR